MSRLQELRDRRAANHTCPISLAERLAGHWLQLATEYSTYWDPNDPRAKDGALIRKRLDVDWPVTGGAARLLQIKHWLRTTQAMRDLISRVIHENPYETKPDDYVRHVRNVIIDAINHDFPPTRTMIYPTGDVVTTNSKEEITMDKVTTPVSAPILSTVTYVYGTDVKTMSEDAIISMVERLDADMERIAPLANNGSVALQRRREKINEARKVLIDELDSREQ